MKTIVLVLLFPLFALADPVAWFPVGKAGAITNYAARGVCESREAHPCIDVGRCPLDECSLVRGKMVLDSSKRAAKDSEAIAQAKKEMERADLIIALSRKPGDFTAAEIQQAIRALLKEKSEQRKPQ